MDRIEELIRYSTENEEFDLKAEEFRKEQFGELIKDVLAFSNANFAGDRYIIIGIKKGTGDPVVYPVDPKLDTANLEQLIHENIFPEVKVSYEPYNFEGQNIMVLVIHNPTDQPYMMAKNYSWNNGKGNLAKHEMWIRKGSFKLLMSRHDLDRIYKKKLNSNKLDGKIDLTFLNGSHSIDIESVRNIQLPSDVQKAQIEQQLREREHLFNTNIEEYKGRYTGRWDPQQNYYSMDLNQLRTALDGVKRKYETEDDHYLKETRAYKLNLLINNSGNVHLENVMVVLFFPVIEGLTVMPRIAPSLYQLVVPSGGDNEGYPKVAVGTNEVKVTQNITEVRHQLQVKVFKMELRMIVSEVIMGLKLPIQAQVFAANLTVPFQTTLTFQFI